VGGKKADTSPEPHHHTGEWRAHQPVSKKHTAGPWGFSHELIDVRLWGRRRSKKKRVGDKICGAPEKRGVRVGLSGSSWGSMTGAKKKGRLRTKNIEQFEGWGWGVVSFAKGKISWSAIEENAADQLPH